jgi:hypothetical protein
MKLDVVVDVKLPPEDVVAALTDFSPRRPEIWRNIVPERYEVHEVGAHHAVVTESGPPALWARERYEWEPGRVRWTVEESNFCTPGSFVEAHVTPHGAGSRVDLHWERRPSNLMGYGMLATMGLAGRAMLRKSIRDGLAAAEQSASS